MRTAATATGGSGRLSGKLLILRLTARGLWRGRRGGSRSAGNSVSRRAEKDVLSQPFRRGEAQIGVIRRERAVRGWETAGSRALVLGSVGWYAEVGRKG